jgi:hypothetical protein
MGKKRIITKEEEAKTGTAKTATASGTAKSDGAKSDTAKPAAAAPAKTSKKRVDFAKLYVQSTYNNTLVSVSDRQGNVLMASSSGALGFRGEQKLARPSAPKRKKWVCAKLTSWFVALDQAENRRFVVLFQKASIFPRLRI